MKPRLRKILLSTLAGILLVLLGVSYFVSRHQEDFRIYPYRTRINVRGDARSAFVSSDEIFRLLPFKSTDSNAMYVQTQQLETLLIAKSPYIRRAEVFISPSAMALNIRIDERHPILTFYRGNQAYYLDSEGKEVINHPGTSAYVPVAVGDLSKEAVQNILFPIARFLQEEHKWSHFFSLIDVVSENCIHLYPRVGDFIFELQGVETLSDDIEKIPIFYKEIVPKVGSNKYKLIKLSFKDQIVCQKRQGS